jgi:hypothetical protein
MEVRSHARHVLFGALLVAAPIAFAVPTAQAGVLVDTAVGCDNYRFERPFDRWADPFNYVLVPNGTFERSAQGWQLTAGVRVVPGNEAYYVHRRGERRSLRLGGSNAVANSPAMCVQAGVLPIELYPTMRFFARNLGAVSSTLRVDVRFEGPDGDVLVAPIALLHGSERWASTRWEPTDPIAVVANLLPNLGDPLLGESAVAFRFSPQDNDGDWRIDDVYVDPYRSR